MAPIKELGGGGEERKEILLRPPIETDRPPALFYEPLYFVTVRHAVGFAGWLLFNNLSLYIYFN